MHLSLNLFVLLLGLSAVDATEVLTIHGSGTTNPSRCYWSVMENIMQQTKLPVRLTYRAVGSTIGQAEFLNGTTHFGSGDLPLSEDQYNEAAAFGGVVHLPVLLGAVNFFHSVPGVGQLNLTGCTLAKIFSQQITKWSDPEITADNPNLPSSVDGLDIFVGRRVRGSSSTASATNYMKEQCPDVYPDNQVGAAPYYWPPEFMECQGSSGMVNCLVEQEGSIGYMDAGHGRDAGLSEVALLNQAGKWQTSAQAAAERGIEQAEHDVWPASTEDSFHDVSLLDRPGTYTWPLVLVTYVYIRKDLSGMTPVERGLLMAFLDALYLEDFVGKCSDEYGFTLPSSVVQEFAKGGRDLLRADATEWTFEKDSMRITGHGDYVISSKRKQISDLERNELIDLTNMLTVEVAQLKAEMETTARELIILGELADDNENSAFGAVFGSDDESQIKSALALAIISFCFWILYFLYTAYAWVTKK